MIARSVTASVAVFIILSSLFTAFVIYIQNINNHIDEFADSYAS